jgi:hypothetical protein
MIFTVLGIIGVVLSLSPFILMQMGKLDGRGVWYTGMNWVGAGLVLISMISAFNLPAFLVEGTWFCISFVSWVVALRRK